MSAGASTLRPGPRSWSSLTRRDLQATESSARPGVRLVAFTAFAAYGMERWTTLLSSAPGWRMVGVLLVAVALAGAVPMLLARSRVAGLVATVLLLAVTFPIAGLPWHWFIHLRLAVSADRIGTGLTALPTALVPYLGTSPAVRLVIVLGAAVLVLVAAAVIGFSERSLGDGRRAAAALALTALAVVPSTLVRPEWPYLQGLLLFALLAAFLWGERVRRPAAASALVMVTLAGVAGAIVAPGIDQGKPWVDYRAWTGMLVRQHVDSFDWNQTYGPLRWPRNGHEVLTVQARTGDYWKAADLSTFDGYSWIAEPHSIQPALPPPARAAVARWSQTLRVGIVGMRTTDVIAAGYAQQPPTVARGVREGDDAGTWITGQTLGPGATYEVSTYSPHPSAAQLSRAGRAYPAESLNSDLTLGIPLGSGAAADVPQITFPLFDSHAQPSINGAGVVSASFVTQALARSPYAGAYALARGLAVHARTPYAFVAAVERQLGHGFAYNENPPASRYPLESFLLHTRQGYCQQFSGAMAMLLRMGGIPARVASGFTSGTYDSGTHRWIVTDTDAHAWVEAWFPRYGWVRFDPTPTAAPARGGATPAAIEKGDAAKGSPIGNGGQRNAGAAGSTSTVSHAHLSGGPSPWLIVLAIATAVAAGWLLWRLLAWRRAAGDPLDELERAWSRTGRPLADGVTLATLEQRLGASSDAAAYIRTLRLARYGGATARPTAAQRRALRQELGRGLGITGRIEAWSALPPRLARHAARHTARGRS